MKKRAVKVLLPLLFSCFFVFSGFLNVSAYAWTIPLDTVVVKPDATDNWSFSILSDDIYDYYNCGYDAGEFSTEFHITNSRDNVREIGIVFYETGFTYPYNYEEYDYYLSFSLFFSDTQSSVTSVSEAMISCRDVNGVVSFFRLEDIRYGLNQNSSSNIYKNNLVLVGRIPDNFGLSTFRNFFINCSGSVVASTYNEFTFFMYQVPKGTDVETVNSLISAINNQTGALQGSIGEAADDVQQSIEDQYSGDPETEFSVDDVISQHNEKMGVLSFGSDVMLQFLDMFQSANVGTAQLTLPGFNITVENVEYSVWPDYSFNFEQLNEWVPRLMSVIRLMLPAFVWLMVLRYCINVFEKNFLSNGG